MEDLERFSDNKESILPPCVAAITHAAQTTLQHDLQRSVSNEAGFGRLSQIQMKESMGKLERTENSVLRTNEATSQKLKYQNVRQQATMAEVQDAQN
ncbi:hypothetical protein N7488_009751 [Penicillium malachiteum]|nr:hypothetical protein N7488_009751 [Penicillium malachiteum]